jgi:hypothetical protein
MDWMHAARRVKVPANGVLLPSVRKRRPSHRRCAGRQVNDRRPLCLLLDLRNGRIPQIEKPHG